MRSWSPSSITFTPDLLGAWDTYLAVQVEHSLATSSEGCVCVIKRVCPQPRVRGSRYAETWGAWGHCWVLSLCPPLAQGYFVQLLALGGADSALAG